MFKKNYDHLPKDTYFGMYKEATRGNPNYFLTYGNGKSAARVQDHLRPNGAHRWHNYAKSPNEIKLEEAAVLHYTYTKFSDLTSRRDRCGCKPTKDDVKRCFMLDFDRAAFIIASTASEEEMLRWYNERVVWNDKQLNLKLLRKGVLTRIYTPMVRNNHGALFSRHCCRICCYLLLTYTCMSSRIRQLFKVYVSLVSSLLPLQLPNHL
jgi:hypothetical protein